MTSWMLDMGAGSAPFAPGLLRGLFMLVRLSCRYMNGGGLHPGAFEANYN